MSGSISDKKVHQIGKGLVDGFKDNRWGAQFAGIAPNSDSWRVANTIGESSVTKFLEAEGIADDNHNELVNKLQAHGYIIQRKGNSGVTLMDINTTYHFPTRKERVESWLPWITFLVAFIAAYPQFESFISAILDWLQGILQ